MIAPCQTIGPLGEPVWIATSWGIPASLLVNVIWNGAPAGAVRSVLSNAMPDAVSSRTVPDAAPEAAGEPARAPEGAALAPGAPLPAGAALAAASAALGAAGAADLNASFQQAGTGVAPAGRTYVGSRQPVSVTVFPVTGSTPWNCTVDGAVMKAISSWMLR